MKKMGVLLLAAALVMSMTACGGGNRNTGEGTTASGGNTSTEAGAKSGEGGGAVSYTHLDVYKRQSPNSSTGKGRNWRSLR